MGLVAALIGRRDRVPDTLLERYPELREAHWRRGGVPPVVGGLFLRPQGAAAVTLWNTVFLAPGVPWDAELLLHELRHVHQFQARRTFPIRYIVETLRRGYHANRFEADARDWARHRVRGVTHQIGDP